jgi:hypothetical protein
MGRLRVGSTKEVKPPDQVLKQWGSLNLSSIITNPTRYDSKHPGKANLVDVILTKNPDIRYQSGVFCNVLSDHNFYRLFL